MISGHPGRLLVPTDFSPPSAAAWPTARQPARALGAELVLLHVLVEAPAHGRGGLQRALLGSVTDRVPRLASCPVVTVRA